MNRVDPLRPGYHTVTPYLAVEDALAAHEFYQRAFGAVVVARLDAPDGRVVHGALRFGDSIVVVVDEMEPVGLRTPRNGGTCSISLSVEDADAVFARAVAAGARAVVPVRESFAGERHGLLVCPFGHRWIVSTRTEDLSDEEIAARFHQKVARVG